jgi:hypothetical protein
MEPRREELQAPQAGAGEKPKRFRIVKLEERIAPTKGGDSTNNCPISGNCSGLGCTGACPTMCCCHHGSCA